MKQQKMNPTLKRTAVTVVAVVYLGFMGWLLWHYENLAPSRTTSAMLSAISDKSDYATAYKLTAKTFQANVPFTKFTAYFQPVGGSQVKYTVLNQKVHGQYAVVNGEVEDLHGVNYLYEFHLVKHAGSWQVDATNADPEE